jgi:hypothetical protein
MKDNHSSASIVTVSRLPDIHLLKTVNRPMSKPLSMAEVSLTMDKITYRPAQADEIEHGGESVLIKYLPKALFSPLEHRRGQNRPLGP